MHIVNQYFAANLVAVRDVIDVRVNLLPWKCSEDKINI